MSSGVGQSYIQDSRGMCPRPACFRHASIVLQMMQPAQMKFVLNRAVMGSCVFVCE